MKQMKPWILGTALMTMSTTFIVCKAVDSAPIWSEKKSAQALVQLPDLRPIIAELDEAVVHIATSSAPKKRAPQGMPEEGPQGLPNPLNPEDFFERFFGQPFRGFGGPEQQQRRSLGSGFIISQDGYILTNNHVVDEADKIEVGLLNQGRNDEKIPAKLIGRDAATDIALLKIETKTPLKMAYFGDSAQLKKGDWVLAFGNPFGLDHSVSVGIVSALGREISPNQNRRFDDFIQTDAAINFGNSGGPLVNLKGEVIGINTAITAQGSGIGFAVPINVAKAIVTQLKETGSVSRGYLGVNIQDLTPDMMEAFGLKEPKGVVVHDLVKGGPAEKSDIRRGDVVFQVNDEKVDDARALQKVIGALKPGESVTLQLYREKKPMKVKVKLGDLGEQDPQAAPGQKAPQTNEPDRLGLILGLSEKGGVQIQDVEAGSAAADALLQPGDLILKMGAKEISSLSDYQTEVGKLKPGQRILLDIGRAQGKLFISLKVPEESKDSKKEKKK